MMRREDHFTLWRMLEDGLDPETILSLPKSTVTCRPLHYLSYRGDIRLIQLLLAYKADINSLTSNGETALMSAAAYGFLECAKVFVENGADLSIKENGGNTALHYAIGNNHSTIAEYLIESGSPFNLTDDKGDAPVHLAAYNGNLELLQTLLQHGVSPELSNAHMRTPLHIAARLNDRNIINLLVQHGARVDARDENGYTPLLYAASRGCLRGVRLLVKHGADVNARTAKGKDSLMVAAGGDRIYEKGQLLVIAFLMGTGADIDQHDTDGWTPLHSAVKEGKVEITTFLLEQGVSYNSSATDTRRVFSQGPLNGRLVGGTPLEIARQLEYGDIIKLLEQHDHRRVDSTPQ
jgi:ankyrin repeat domain-containing protein 50